MADDSRKFTVIQGGKSDQDKGLRLRIIMRDDASDELYQKERVRELRKYLRKKRGREPTDDEVMNILASQDGLPSDVN